MEVLPKDTIICIQQTKVEGDKITPSAVELEFVLNQPTKWGQVAHNCKVVRNPNGWSHGTVNHRLNKDCDIIVFLPSVANNITAKELLRKEESY